MHDAQATLITRLEALPKLAADTLARDHARSANAGRVHTTRTGSKPPPGVDLDHIDLSHGREQPALLARLGKCVRVVCEEVDMSLLPDLCEEGKESWTGECAWLIRTMPHWIADAWCTEWIDTETSTIERKLTARHDQITGPTRRTCPTCRTPITAHTTDTLMVASCPHCERVAAMKPRLTPEQRSAAQLRGARALLAKIGAAA